MGLDMFLKVQHEKYASDYYKNPFLKNEYPKDMSNIFDVVKAGQNNSVTQIMSYNAGYWRKANAIHNWFVKNIQYDIDNCAEYQVSCEKLKELRDLCLQVRDAHDLADTLLPTKAGFFFGSTEYDEYYFENIEKTIAICNAVIEYYDKWWDDWEKAPEDSDQRYTDLYITYHASW